MPHVSVSSYTTAVSTPFKVTIRGVNTMLHPSIVWLTKSDFGFLGAQFAMPDSSGNWEAVFDNVPMGDYVYYAQCANDVDATGNQSGTVPRGDITPDAARKIIAAVTPPPGVTLADIYPRQVAAFGLGRVAKKPLSFAGFVTYSSKHPGPITPVVTFIPGDRKKEHFKYGVADVQGHLWHHKFGKVDDDPRKTPTLRVHFPDGSFKIDLQMELEG